MTEAIKNSSNQILSLLSLGEQARDRGDLERARRLFRVAMRSCLHDQHNEEYLVRITTAIADTHFDEADYDRAHTWYSRALQISILLYGESTMQVAELLTKLAELCAIQSKFDQCQALFENAQNIYLLSKSSDISAFLNSLIDLSWALCVRNKSEDAHEVNILISHINEEFIESNANII